MEQYERINNLTNNNNEIKIFNVPFSLDEIENKLFLNLSIDINNSIESLINQAFKFHGIGDIHKAERCYKALIERQIKDPRVFCNLGVIFKERGELVDSVILFRKAIKLKPNFVEYYSNLGLTLVELGRFSEAEKIFRKALSLNHLFDNLYLNLGTVLTNLKKFEEAEIYLRKAIKLKPLQEDAFLNLAILLTKLDKLEEAEFINKKGININPQRTELYLSLSDIYRRQEKLKNSETSLLKAIELNPLQPKLFLNLSNIKKDLGKLEEAIAILYQALKLNPNYSSAHLNLGVIFLNLGELSKSKIHTLKAIKINPSFKEAYWNLYGLSDNIKEAELIINKCLEIDNKYIDAKLTQAALRFHQGDKSLFRKLIKSSCAEHPLMTSIIWVSRLPNLPQLFYHRWSFFDSMINQSIKSRPFYEFGVWRGVSFKYLINTFKKGFGFDTFLGLPEDWNMENKIGSYSAEGEIPSIEGGVFVDGKFEDTLPNFFSIERPKASIINFDCDLYTSTICALNYSRPVIDHHTILIFDEFITNKNWENDEYKALNEFCFIHQLSYEVLAISYITKQVAVRIINI